MPQHLGQLPAAQDAQPGAVARAARGVGALLRGASDAWEAWFGPGTPLLPAAPPEVAGRAFDYPVATNINYIPKAYEGIDYPQLRALADGWDLLRTVIETRKDEAAALRWSVKPIDPKKKPDDRCKRIEDFLRCPDGEHDWDQWYRMLLEELFVIDAASIYRRRRNDGTLGRLEIVAGDTIKRLVDQTGRTPMEGIAYQQILKGVVAADLTREDLIYYPRNVRANRFYGLGNVEQILVTVNIALRRQARQLDFYEVGTVPDMLLGAPADWPVSKLREMQAWWDEMTAPDAPPRRVRFINGGVTPHMLKAGKDGDVGHALFDTQDEWLARVVCFCFSVSPQPFLKMMNRATAETAQEQAVAQGLRPITTWTRNLVGRILREDFDAPDLCFAPDEEEAIDPETRAKVNSQYVTAGILLRDEVRADMGRDPLPKEAAAPVAPQAEALQGPQILAMLQMVQAPGLPPETLQAMLEASFPKVDPELVAKIVAGAPKAQPAEPAAALSEPAAAGTPPPAPDAVKLRLGRLSKACRKVHLGVGVDSRLVKAHEAAVRRTMRKALRAQVAHAAAHISERVGKVAKADSDLDAKVEALVGTLNLKDPDKLRKALADLLADEGKEVATVELGNLDRDDDALVRQVNQGAVDWAEQRAGELVTEIEEGTRSLIRSDVAQALQEGWSTAELADHLVDSAAFSDARAELIARTETAKAAVQGNLAAWRASGVVERKVWMIGEGACDECEPLDGEEVALGSDFPGDGGDGPPLHPNCRCDVGCIVAEALEDTTQDEED